MGLRLDPETGEALDRLVEDEQKRIGHSGKVTGASLITALIHAEHGRRFKGKKG